MCISRSNKPLDLRLLKSKWVDIGVYFANFALNIAKNHFWSFACTMSIISVYQSISVDQWIKHFRVAKVVITTAIGPPVVVRLMSRKQSEHDYILKRWVLSHRQNADSDSADVTCCGLSFQIILWQTTGKVRLLTVDGLTWGTFLYRISSGPYARGGGLGGTKTPPPNSQKYTKKVHTLCISKIQGSFITL